MQAYITVDNFREGRILYRDKVWLWRCTVMARRTVSQQCTKRAESWLMLTGLRALPKLQLNRSERDFRAGCHAAAVISKATRYT